MTQHTPPPAIGYLVPEFPTQTHAFFWREMQAIEESGVRVQLFSTRRPPEAACPHAFAEEARGRTRYLFPCDMGAAWRCWPGTRPGRGGRSPTSWACRKRRCRHG